MKRNCARCERRYEARNAQSRYCSPSCRTLAARERKAGKVISDVTVEVTPRASAVTSSVEVTLAKAGRLSHPSAQAALSLARRIDEGAESSAGHAALVREMRAALAEALDRVKVSSDPVDELRSRREARRRGA